MVKEEARPATAENEIEQVPIGKRSTVHRRRFEQPELPDLMAIFEHRWYLIQVASGRETLVAELMRHRGHQAIVPVVRCWRLANRYARRKSEREFALMARYLILGFRHDDVFGFDDLRRIVFTPQVVSDSEGYEQVSRAELLDFVKFLGTSVWTVDDAQQFMRTGREFSVGDMAEVLSGSLAGWTVRVKRIDGDLAAFDVAMMGRWMEWRLPLAMLGKSA